MQVCALMNGGILGKPSRRKLASRANRELPLSRIKLLAWHSFAPSCYSSTSVLHKDVSDTVNLAFNNFSMDRGITSKRDVEREVDTILSSSKAQLIQARTALEIIDSVDLLFASKFVRDADLFASRWKRPHEIQSAKLLARVRGRDYQSASLVRTEQYSNAASLKFGDTNYYDPSDFHIDLDLGGKQHQNVTKEISTLVLPQPLSSFNNDESPRDEDSKEIENAYLAKIEGLVGILRITCCVVALFGLVGIAEALTDPNPATIILPGFLFIFGGLVASYLHNALRL